ncbi:helix-turn-helix domain-containing protein [Flavobacteriales bacterium]|jgi:transcriptional regulator with XRE-family HTH domain|nr:helix-turn-helix domain-containing protein [Flavobacteriales bacterium]MDB3926982.1 helix-turn-helix domain-containing protein [Flavobacteriales bacterium]
MEKRIQNIIEKYGLSPNAFAQEIDVNRSTISHILSGRNKPSIDVLQKILKRFSKISASWLLMGRGDMIASDSISQVPKTASEQSVTPSKDVNKIVVFYSDNSFEEYKPNK